MTRSPVRTFFARRAPMVVISFVVLVLGFVLLVGTQMMPLQILGIIFIVVGFLAFLVYSFLWDIAFISRFFRKG